MKEQSNNPDKGPSPDSRDAQVTPEGIRDQLSHVLSSPDFKASKKVKTIFRYLTEKTVASRGDQISSHSIANEVYDRPIDPDTPTDVLVRIQLNQLRRALKTYDAGAGAPDDSRIEIPEDRYTPVSHPEKID